MITNIATTCWVGIEGINGVGKTHLTRALAVRLGPRCQVLAELTDAEGEHVPCEVMSALSCGGSFLRTGHPLTETFALMALKVREYELVMQMATPPPIVLEDRGIDTVALYQAAILLGPDVSDDDTWALAQQIHATAAMWRPAPELTLLVTDDIGNCLDRYAEREGAPMTDEEQHLVTRVARLYERQAEHEPERFRIVHRAGRGEDDIVAEMERLVLTGVGER
ncbi:MAG: thymidylate kinase [Actinomycetota bacterium]|nr:thymidylate kinase [Actinomycetota bacterium]